MFLGFAAPVLCVEGQICEFPVLSVEVQFTRLEPTTSKGAKAVGVEPVRVVIIDVPLASTSGYFARHCVRKTEPCNRILLLTMLPRLRLIHLGILCFVSTVLLAPNDPSNLCYRNYSLLASVVVERAADLRLIAVPL